MLYIMGTDAAFREFRNQREKGATQEDALNKAFLKGAVFVIAERLGDYGLKKLGEIFFKNTKNGFSASSSNNDRSGTAIEDFFGENKEITDIEYEEILRFKNCEYKINIQNGVSCFPKTDGIYKNVQKVKPVKYGKTNEYCFDIGMHGNPQNVAFANTNDAPIMTPKALAVAISQNTNYKKGQPVRLLSCSTGKEIPFDDCFAQKLANEINAPVLAPPDILWVFDNGRMEIGKHNQGEWKEFVPIYR